MWLLLRLLREPRTSRQLRVPGLMPGPGQPSARPRLRARARRRTGTCSWCSGVGPDRASDL